MSEIILNNISDCFIGNNHVKEIWYSNTKIWPTTSHDYSLDYLTFESLDNNNSFTINTKEGFSPLIVYYSIDNGDTWQSLTYGQSTPTLDAGEKIIWKCTNSWTRYNNFVSDGRFIVSGNIMSMIYGDNFIGQTTVSTNYTFDGLFSNCSGLIDASNLILPITTLSQFCYIRMFYDCSNLEYGPELPITNLAVGCYEYMFYGCSSLQTAPELPATTLVQQCYEYMFQNCTSLNYIKCLATNISAFDCTYYWVDGVAQTGTFIKDVNMNDWTTGSDGIPTGWTVETI